MSGFVCDGACNGTEFGDCSHSIEAGEKSEETALRERVAQLEVENAELKRLAEFARANYVRRNTEALAWEAKTEIAVKALIDIDKRGSIWIASKARDALAAVAAVKTS